MKAAASSYAAQSTSSGCSHNSAAAIFASQAVALGRWVAKLTKTVALQSWVWDDDRWRWQNRRFIWGRVSVSSVRQMHWRKGSVQARFDFLIGILDVSFWSSCCELFHANGDHADFSLGFFLPLGAILDNAKLILRVQWFVLFGQEVLVQVVHLDAMYFAFWILARGPEACCPIRSRRERFKQAKTSRQTSAWSSS
jgi:hypothetical protein